MSRPKSHKDVEFHVGSKYIGSTGQYRNFDEAAGAAVALSLAQGKKIFIDVVVYSKSGANWYGGDDAVAQYEEDPEASVFERFEVTANNVGRVA